MSDDLWPKLLLRLQSVAYDKCRGHGISVVTARLYLDRGELLAYHTGDIEHLEPRGNGREILARLGVVLPLDEEEDGTIVPLVEG